MKLAIETTIIVLLCGFSFAVFCVMIWITWQSLEIPTKPPALTRLDREADAYPLRVLHAKSWTRINPHDRTKETDAEYYERVKEKFDL